MTFEEYRRYDGLGLAGLVRRKEITPAELLEVAISRAEAVNPKINAITLRMYDEARSRLARVDLSAPFAGVPFLVKDLGIHLKGIRLAVGSRGYLGQISEVNSYLADQFRRAGLIDFARTSTPEWGLTPFTEPELSGPTRNPWDTSRTAGGSSGGSGAAVAAGIAPLATASDGGGSIRIPAANCGLFGLKPTRGRISLGPKAGEAWSGAVVEGCVSRSVRDSAAYLDALLEPMPGDPYQIQKPARPYREEVDIAPPVLRIGFGTGHVLGQAIDPDCEQAVLEAARLLASLGHQVEEVNLPFEKEDLTRTFLTMVAGETAAEMQEMDRHLGRKARPGDVQADTWSLHLLGRSLSAGDYAFQKRRWNDIARRAAAFHQDYNLLLTPTVASAPFPIGALQPSAAERRLMAIVNRFNLSGLLKSQIDPLAEKIFGYIPYTPFANITGQPAMSVPLYRTGDGLPVGVMITAPLGREDLLFQVAGQLEKAKPWFDQVPELD